MNYLLVVQVLVRTPTGSLLRGTNTPPGQEVHNFLVAHLSDLGTHPNIQSQYVGRDNMLSLVAVGRGLTLTSEATIVAQFPGITYRELTGEVLPFSMVIG